MKRIHNLLAKIDTAWAQGDVGNTEKPVQYLIELVGILVGKLQKLETRANRLDKTHTQISVDARLRHEDLSEKVRLAVEGLCDRIERIEQTYSQLNETLQGMAKPDITLPIERMEAGESLKPADDE